MLRGVECHTAGAAGWGVAAPPLNPTPARCAPSQPTNAHDIRVRHTPQEEAQALVVPNAFAQVTGWRSRRPRRAAAHARPAEPPGQSSEQCQLVTKQAWAPAAAGCVLQSANARL